MGLILPKLDRNIPITDKDKGTPSLVFHQWWQRVAQTLERTFDSLETAVIAIEAALEAADIAIAAADAAQAAADNAEAVGEGAERIASLANSGVSGAVLSATDAGTDATVSVTAHTRLYGNGTSVLVDAGSVTGLAYSTAYYVYYDDPSRTGGAVTYQATTSEATAAQTGDRHLVGTVATPAALGADTSGKYVKPPGAGSLEP